MKSDIQIYTLYQASKMSHFIPSDEYIAELLEHSDIEEESCTDIVEDPDMFDICPDFEPIEEPQQEYNEKWIEKEFLSKTILDKMPIPIPQAKKPMEYFSKYIPDELFAQIANHTAQSLKERGKHSKYCTESMIKTFFGVYALMGVFKCPQKQLYFSQKFQYGPISSRITYEKFRQIRTSLHIVDENNPDELEKMTNRLWKVQPILDSVRIRCQQISRDRSHYSIGEHTIDFVSPRIGSKFHWKSRTVGLKNFIVTDSEGLIVDFEIFQGSLTDLPDRHFGTAAAIVLRLARTIPNACLYFGRDFSTMPLMNELAKRDIRATGLMMPCRFKRNIYEFKNDKQMDNGEWQEICRPDGRVCAVKWKESKASLILTSTVFGSKPRQHFQSFDAKTKEHTRIPCPLVLKNYKLNILGVDLNKQMMTMFTTPFKCKKWPVNVILYLFELSLTNAYFEYRNDAKQCKYKRADTLEAIPFRLEIIEALLGENPLKRKHDDGTERVPSPTLVPAYQPPNLDSIDNRFDGKDHWLVTDKSIKSQRQCRREKCKSRTNNMCSKCKIYLCFNHHKNCFYTFHNKLDKKPD